MKKIISVLVIGGILSHCGVQSTRSSAEVKKEREPLSEIIKSVGLGGSSLYIASGLKDDKDKLTPFLFLLSGVSLTIEGTGGLIDFAQEKRWENITKSELDPAINITLSAVALNSSLRGISYYKRASKRGNVLGIIAFGMLTSFSTIEFFGNSYAYQNAKPSGIRTFQLTSALTTLSGQASKQLWKNTFSRNDIASECKNIERKFASSALFVSEDGKILDAQLLGMALASEKLQKKSLDTKDFARQIKLAFTLPHEAPVSVLKQNKVTDPIALNIFKNRSELRSIGLM